MHRPCGVWLGALTSLLVTSAASAQRPPAIVSEFDEEAGPAEPTAPRPAERPPPPIIPDFDGPIDEDEEEAPYALGEGETTDDDPLEEGADEDPAEARRHLQQALLVERRRQMAARARVAPNARSLASPFRSASASAPTDAVAGARSVLPTAIDRLELGVAGTNAPLTSIGLHDDGMRVRVGAGLDAYREPVGFRIRFEPLVVLQSAGTLSLPHEYVRTAFTTTVTYRTPLEGQPIALFLGGGFQHVGDYATTGASGMNMTNQLLVRGGFAFDTDVLHGLARVDVGLHVLSDTSLVSDEGAQQTAELGFDVVLRSGSASAAERNVQLCGAVHGRYVAPSSERIVEEAQLDLSAGVCVREPVLGDLSLWLELELGNVSLWDHTRQTERIGAALRWSL